ncbi:MAG: right-handed parallel beta-helix repeat-containing protein [Planctomycetota bacterium]
MLLRRFATVAYAVVLTLVPAHAAAASTRFVDANLATGANDGSTWANAFQGAGGLQSALALATSGDEIWVADGRYLPSTTLVRTVAFDLKSGVAILGGFAGGETLASQADPVANVAILSGDLAGDDLPNGPVSENSIHVVRGAQADATAVLDGFVVEAGNANVAGGDQDRGGGMLMTAGSNATIRRCIVRKNRCTFGGGAGYIRGSQPSFTDCRFEDNLGSSFGGAFDMANNGSATFERCTFRNNSAARGGGVEIFASASKLSNCLFTGNMSVGAGGGGAIWIGSGSTPLIRNCTIAGNQSLVSIVAGILSSGSTVDIANSIVFSNVGPGGVDSPGNQLAGSTLNVRYSCVTGGFAGAGNTSGPPKFVDVLSGDYRVRVGSPCVDAGDNTAMVAGVALDLSGNARFVDHPAAGDVGSGAAPLVDMGAYETVPQPVTAFCFGDGSELPCPCANEVPLGTNSGCKNWSGVGGVLQATGNPSLAADSVVLTASSLTGASALFAQGTRPAQIAIDDGQSCINGTLVRLGMFAVSGGSSTLSASAAALGGVFAPGARFYQVHYRDGLGVCTTPTTNRTNGVAVIWVP